ncbi:hypothetical protein CHS0354_013542 [Potamilus streckersoni]|uniref:Carbonic anhydrase n=1 Tax=Potamilus streckersoni TaxID=2493646 RepID=A0AAE0W891_9BIVA|nr:hypothetical protein CHS0354_013542 [Potamilus streckersoni]
MIGTTVILLFASAAISNGQDLEFLDDFELASKEVPCHSNWSYDRSAPNGPYCWHTIGYTDCNGSEQSPINIETDKVCYSYFKPIYDDVSYGLHGNLSNSGHDPKFSVAKTERSYNLYKVPFHLNKTFKLKQFHMHFHYEEGNGSEHMINCKGYDGELHFVHHENELPVCIPITHQNVVVLAIFVKKGGKTHKSLQPFFQNLKNVEQCGSHINLTLSALSFLKNLGDLYTYKGSLTNPGCSEGATWLIKRKPMTVSEDDFQMLKWLMWDNHAHIIEHGNVRPTFPMNARRVLANFKATKGDNKCNYGNNDDSDKTRNECTKWYHKSHCGNYFLGLR